MRHSKKLGHTNGVSQSTTTASQELSPFDDIHTCKNQESDKHATKLDQNSLRSISATEEGKKKLNNLPAIKSHAGRIEDDFSF